MLNDNEKGEKYEGNENVVSEALQSTIEAEEKKVKKLTKGTVKK